MSRRRGWLALYALVLLLVFCWPRPWLVVSELHAQGTLERRYVFPGDDGTRFSLCWQHSVEREDWIETFALSKGAIRVVSSRFKTFGAGVPDTGQASRLEQGWVVLDDIARPVDPLLVQAAAREHYRMGYGGYWLDLGALGPAPTLRFQQQRLPPVMVLAGLWRPWWHRMTHG
ncbi:hypothetical protein GCM10010082_21470 [Kushneria pakistanensis]|uniref:DUF1850 domain-containing protein n=1 Tax=Kushneria pakistanensis TaxID=1508770 RepID=A0ABQ3FK84_9GAMM|nr:DUF1850 domain-containing protein [Kushneria pakistanensis]GHC27943.1 hypothetical protein GCM10010082_21470 [Kushneria pakistanensis]